MRSDHDTSRILIIGADSLIGRALYLRLTQCGYEVLTTTRRKDQIGHNMFYLDFVHNLKDWVIPKNISAAFICAAVNSLELCRQEPSKTALINTLAPITLTQRLVEHNIFTIFLSTNLVFDGSVPFVKALTQPHPQTEHGRQKAQAEQALLKHKSHVSVIRLSKVFGPQMQLLQNWLAALSQQEPIYPFADKIVAPLTLSVCTDFLVRAAEKRTPGIFQISAHTDYTYSQLAYRTAQLFKADPQLIKPISAKNSKIFLEHLPQYSTMDGQATEQSLVLKIPEADRMRDEAIYCNMSTFKTFLNVPPLSV